MMMHSTDDIEPLLIASEAIEHESSLVVARSIEARALSKKLRERATLTRKSVVFSEQEMKAWIEGV